MNMIITISLLMLTCKHAVQFSNSRRLFFILLQFAPSLFTFLEDFLLFIWWCIFLTPQFIQLEMPEVDYSVSVSFKCAWRGEYAPISCSKLVYSSFSPFFFLAREAAAFQ